MGSKKTEKMALSKLENLLLRVDFVDYKLKADDTGISWDGTIDLYHGDIEKKDNFDDIISVQVKGRTTTNKRLQDKYKFPINKKDLENYLKVDGTMYFVVLFKNIDNYKIYYVSLLPYNLKRILKETPNSKDEIKVKLKEIKDSNHLEKILRNFSVDKNCQKKISSNVFEQGELLTNNHETEFIFYDWNKDKSSILELIGKEKYLYHYDDLNNITSITYAPIGAIQEQLNNTISSKSGEVYYSVVNHIITKTSNTIEFGNAFKLDTKSGKFDFRIIGSFSDRIKQVKFIKCLIEDGCFKINEHLIKLKMDGETENQLSTQIQIYNDIELFMQRHNINKNLDLDNWKEQDINRLLTWIYSIDKKIPIKVSNFETSVMGSIRINELTLSIFADKRPDGSFNVYSIWNTEDLNSFIFKYNNGETKIETKKTYLVLNNQAYIADDLNLEDFHQEIANTNLTTDEQVLMNLQVLEVIKAYDINNNEELLEYAEFILSKIDSEEMADIVYINKMQIYKRKRELTIEEINHLIEIKNNRNELFYTISINLLIDNKNEAKLDYSKLAEDQKIIYSDFPIFKFFN